MIFEMTKTAYDIEANAGLLRFIMFLHVQACVVYKLIILDLLCRAVAMPSLKKIIWTRSKE